MSSLLHVEGLQVEFATEEGVVRAVDGVSYQLAAGETIGVVGESGSGKSVTHLALLGLVPRPPGRIAGGRAIYRGRDLLGLGPRQLAEIRGHRIAMIFQDPMTALNPFLTIGDQMTEVTRTHLGHSRQQARRHAIEMLERVGLPAAGRRMHDYPHQFSGGMRQRVMIAMALSCRPEVLIADEPTTALDVTIQAQILERIRDLAREEGTATILIAHDMGVIASICQRVLVMYAGRVVEESSVDDLFARPRHPYTIGLLRSIPRLDEPPGEQLVPIPGQPPDLARLPSGCAFHPRCPWRMEICTRESPRLEVRARERVYACFADVDQPQPAEAAHG